MTATKKSIRFLTVLALIFAMVLSIASVPASAAGVETWNQSEYFIWEQPFTMRGYNLTPVKTMGTMGRLHLLLTVDFLDANPNPANVKLEVRSTNGTVLKTFTQVMKPGFGPGISEHIDVMAGQKIQLYMSAYDSVTGNYRTVSVEYAHWLTVLTA